MDRFVQLFGHFVEFSYACWDLIVLRSYYPRLQRPENNVHFFRDLCGDVPTPVVLARGTSSYRRWLKRSVVMARVPMATWPESRNILRIVAAPGGLHSM